MAPVFCFGPMEGQNGSHFEKPKRPHGAKTALFFLLCSPKTKPIEKAPELVHELLVIVIISLAQNVHIIKTNPYCSNVYPVLMFIYNKLPFIGP